MASGNEKPQADEADKSDLEKTEMKAYSMKVNAINAARRFMADQALSGDWSEHFYIDSIGPRQFVVQHKQMLDRSNAWESLIVQTEGRFEFPQADDIGYGDKIEDDERLEAERQAERIANAQASEETLPNGKLWIRQSSILKPVKAVWHIADEMIAANPQVTRREVQAECERRGIASGTARTQYQAWKKSRDNTLANQELAASLSAKLNGGN